MIPYHQALTHYGVEEFIPLHEWHLVNGVVIATQELFLMARPVSSQWTHEMDDITRTDPDGDCWHVWYCAGSMKAACQALQFSEGKEFVSYHRRGRLCVAPIRRITR